MTYKLTLILSDDRGATKVVLTVDAAHMLNSPNVNPIFGALAQLHEHTMPAEKPEKEPRP